MYKIRRLGISAAVSVLAVPAPVPALAISPDSPAAQIITVVADGALDNLSGLALAENGQLMFTVQDARRSTLLYALDRRGRTAFTVPLPKGGNEDWEDLATGTLADGRRVVVIADTGDAFQVRRGSGQRYRTSFRILRFDEPDAAAKGPSGLVSHPVRYPDLKTRNVETLLLQPGTGRIYLVTKTQAPAAAPGAASQPPPAAAEVWELPENPSTENVNVLREVTRSLPVPAASGGAFSPSGDRLVVRNGENAFVWWVERGEVANALTREPVKIHLPPQRQGEGVAFTRDGHALLVNSEGSRQPIWRVPLPRSADTASPPTPPTTETRAEGIPRTPLTVFALLMFAASAGIAIHKIRTRRE
ncbi:hypothetical protein ABGB12_04380 [Actinocorallia sp. B10E7]|uniref:hypothetical protein n=1 Tax=Actinocorallia sp. B10E7 TaxID=3153558 RepID=UPI00325DFDF0